MRRPLFFLLAIIVLLADQATKLWAMHHLVPDLSRTIIPRVFYLTRTTNTGGAFGLFPSATSLLALTALAAVVGIIIYAARTRWPLPAIVGVALALPLGGAAGNFLDRVRLGHVVDFLDVRFGDYSWPVFNVADSAICIGVVLLAYSFIRYSPSGHAPQERTAGQELPAPQERSTSAVE